MLLAALSMLEGGAMDVAYGLKYCSLTPDGFDG